jgi:ribosomal subunit interface protein
MTDDLKPNEQTGEFREVMKILLKYCGLNARASWRELVEAQLKKLENLAAIASAKVTLECEREAKPAFHVVTWLEIPGPDVHAEARDYTLQAALLKVVKDLERQIRSRKSRRAERWKTNPQLGWIAGQAGCRA